MAWEILSLFIGIVFFKSFTNFDFNGEKYRKTHGTGTLIRDLT